MSLLSRLFFSTNHIPFYPTMESLSLPSQTEMEHIRTRNVSFLKPISRETAFKYLNENDEDIALPHPTNNTIAPVPIQQEFSHKKSGRQYISGKSTNYAMEKLTLQVLRLY